MKLRPVLITVAAALCLQSCLVQDMSAPTDIFEVDDIILPADVPHGYGKGDGVVVAYVPVRSSGNWSATIKDAERTPWLRIGSQNGLNPDGADVSGSLELICDENPSAESRSAVLHFVTASAQIRDVNVTQSAKTPRISIDGDNACTLDAESEKPVKIKILSNSAWTVLLDLDASTCNARIEPTEGKGDAVVTITPDPNYDCNSSAVAVVNFIAEGGDSTVFRLTRSAGTPFMGANPVDVSQYKLPASTSGTLRFNCNAAWKAEILESSIKDFSLDTLQGPGGMNSLLPFKMSANEGDESLSARVKLSLQSDKSKNVVLTVTQWSGFSVDLDFSSMTDAASCPLQPAADTIPQIPYTTTTGLNSGGKEYTYKFITGGKEYLYGISNSLINVAGTGKSAYIRLSKGYIKFPAVEGYKLAYVELTTAATSKLYSIASNPDGSGLIGATKNTAKEETVSWELSGTEYNTSYYEIIGSANSRQHNLILLYVK